jgi:hypothetical protein
MLIAGILVNNAPKVGVKMYWHRKQNGKLVM